MAGTTLTFQDIDEQQEFNYDRRYRHLQPRTFYRSDNELKCYFGTRQYGEITLKQLNELEFPKK
jgi:hypothetical protein